MPRRRKPRKSAQPSHSPHHPTQSATQPSAIAAYVSPTPKAFSYALVAHNGNGGKIAQVDGLYTSSEFAAMFKHSNVNLAVHKAQLQATEASLAKIKPRFKLEIKPEVEPEPKPRSVFRLMELPEELRRIILVMGVQQEFQDTELVFFTPRRLPAIASVRNKQLRLEAILAVLQNRLVIACERPESLERWLSTISFDLLQQAGITPIRNGFGAVRTAKFWHISRFVTINSGHADRLVRRFANLRELIVNVSDAEEMFEIGSDPDMFGDALGAKMRAGRLDLPSFDLLKLRKLTVTVRFFSLSHEEWKEAVAAHVPEWRTVIDHGCQKVAEWLSEEYDARGLKVEIDIHTDFDC